MSVYCHTTKKEREHWKWVAWNVLVNALGERRAIRHLKWVADGNRAAVGGLSMPDGFTAYSVPHYGKTKEPCPCEHCIPCDNCGRKVNAGYVQDHDEEHIMCFPCSDDFRATLNEIRGNMQAKQGRDGHGRFMSK